MKTDFDRGWEAGYAQRRGDERNERESSPASPCSAIINRWRDEAKEDDQKAKDYGRRGLETSATMYRTSADTFRLCALELEKEIRRQNTKDLRPRSGSSESGCSD